MCSVYDKCSSDWAKHVARGTIRSISLIFMISFILTVSILQIRKFMFVFWSDLSKVRQKVNGRMQWKLIRNEYFSVPFQIYRIRMCILTWSPDTMPVYLCFLRTSLKCFSFLNAISQKSNKVLYVTVIDPKGILLFSVKPKRFFQTLIKIFCYEGPIAVF